ncbi:MAG: hypothetical protein M3R00_01000 [Pseudomonadota bacterium]|nr:hypothetical protein [Pseudomonadota bacterium]
MSRGARAIDKIVYNYISILNPLGAKLGDERYSENKPKAIDAVGDLPKVFTEGCGAELEIKNHLVIFSEERYLWASSDE